LQALLFTTSITTTNKSQTQTKTTVKQPFMSLSKALFICLCISVVASACNFYHFYTKKEVIKNAKKRERKKKGSVIIEDDNSLVKILTRDSSYQKVDEVFEFNDNGTQHKYTIIASCDSCFQKFLSTTISSHIYKWKKLNDTTYISKYSLKRFLNIHPSTHSYDMVEHNQSRIECKNLIKAVGK
jgi:hypothetical protein